MAMVWVFTLEKEHLMRLQILILLAAVVVGLAACPPEGTKRAEPIEYQPTYGTDPRTGLCFAWQHAEWTHVPCTPEVLTLTKQY